MLIGRKSFKTFWAVSILFSADQWLLVATGRSLEHQQVENNALSKHVRAFRTGVATMEARNAQVSRNMGSVRCYKNYLWVLWYDGTYSQMAPPLV